MKMTEKFNRRLFLKLLAGAGILGIAGNGGADEFFDEILVDSSRSMWGDPFDSQAEGGVQVASNQPVLSLATTGYTEMAIAKYKAIVAAGGWPEVPMKKGDLYVGMVDPVIAILRDRLTKSGDLASQSGEAESFDTYVEAAVRRFQLRHGLPGHGVVNAITYRAMNVDAHTRLNQLYTNLERLHKEVPNGIGKKRFVMVNIPAAQIEAVEDNVVFQRFTGIVGKIDRQTPLLVSKIHEIILNPFWTVPKSIIRKDIIPLMRHSPTYLTDNHIRLYDYQGNEVRSESVNWNTDEAVDLMFRQDPGKINAMSSTKINFHNTHAVYMHDTPTQGLFNNLMRFDTSGCIRIQNIRDFNLWILKNTPGWDRARMEAVIHSRQNTPIAVKDPVPLYFVYISAWSTNDGVVQFRDDIYHLDGDRQLSFGEEA